VGCNNAEHDLGGIHVGNPFDDQDMAQQTIPPYTLGEEEHQKIVDGTLKEFTSKDGFKIYLPHSLRHVPMDEDEAFLKLIKNFKQVSALMKLEEPGAGDSLRIYALSSLGELKGETELNEAQSFIEQKLNETGVKVSFQKTFNDPVLGWIGRWEEGKSFFEIQLILSPLGQILVSEIKTEKKQALIQLSHQIGRIKFDLSAPKIYRAGWVLIQNEDHFDIQIFVFAFDQFSRFDLTLELELLQRLPDGAAIPLKPFKGPLLKIKDEKVALGNQFRLPRSALALSALKPDEHLDLEVARMRVVDRAGNAAILMQRDDSSTYIATDLSANIYEDPKLHEWLWWTTLIPKLSWTISP
jgi:hypothetical protein